MLAYAATAAGTMVLFFIENTFTDREFSNYIVERQNQLRQHYDTLLTRFNELEQRISDYQAAVKTIPPTLTQNNEESVQLADATLSSRLDTLENSTAALRDDLRALRSVLNPTDPNDVLTVLRLGDKFELLTNELDSIRADIDETSRSVDQRIQANYENTTKHVDTVTNTIGWMALLLVPILLNAVRDFLPRKKPPHAEDPNS